MSERVVVPWSDDLIGYDFGPGHPLAPVRVDLTMRLARALGLFACDAVTSVGVAPASDAELATVHTPAYLAAVKEAGSTLRGDSRYGLGSPDNPVFAGMHAAAAAVCGATLVAARAVGEGRAQHAVNVAGGLHHAMPDSASGFCVYNDPAVAIAWFLQNGASRVAYVDIDVHHGDGVQQIFYEDPRVLTVSVHEDGRFLFPGTGSVDETGAGHTAVNIPLPPGTGDAGWLRAFHALVPALVRAFAPEVLVSQHGCDTHRLDPLAHLNLSLDAQRAAHAALHDLAHSVCAGRWLALGGGGYELVQVVPRSWTHLLFEAAGSPIDPLTSTPAPWREEVRTLTGQLAPKTMGEEVQVAYTAWPNGADPVDSVIQVVREEALAALGASSPGNGG